MLGVFVSPHYAKDQSVYLTYAEPNGAVGDRCVHERCDIRSIVSVDRCADLVDALVRHDGLVSSSTSVGSRPCSR